MEKVLVLGGTRFFGIHLVNELITQGCEVTVATRGRSTIPFEGNVRFVRADRTNKQEMMEVFHSEKWSVVYDQICYSSREALDAIEVFQNKTDKYIFTSSLSVYPLNEKSVLVKEEDFDPYTEPLVIGESKDFTYQEGKRQAETAFFQKASFPVTAVRFPIVLVENDYTERLTSYIQKIKYKKPVYFDNRKAEMVFISEQEAGRFLAWLASVDLKGPVNACSEGSITLERLMKMIAEVTGEKILYNDKETESPYNIPKTWTMSNQKAVQNGYRFTCLDDWLPDLIEKKANELSS